MAEVAEVAEVTAGKNNSSTTLDNSHGVLYCLGMPYVYIDKNGLEKIRAQSAALGMTQARLVTTATEIFFGLCPDDRHKAMMSLASRRAEEVSDAKCVS